MPNVIDIEATDFNLQTSFILTSNLPQPSTLSVNFLPKSIVDSGIGNPIVKIADTHPICSIGDDDYIVLYQEHIDRLKRTNKTGDGEGFLSDGILGFMSYLLCGKYSTKVPVLLPNILIEDWARPGRDEKEILGDMIRKFRRNPEYVKVDGKEVKKNKLECQLQINIFLRKGTLV